MTESDIVSTYFFRAASDSSVIVPSGDDAAVVSIPSGRQLVMSMDTLVANRHFPYQDPNHLLVESDHVWHTSPFDIGYKSVAVNLSDIAAMGAEPKWITVSLTLPDIQTSWLSEFSRGMYSLLDCFNVQLIGGDLVKGALSITIQAHGFLPNGKALLRSGAQVGDDVYVSGRLGAPTYALQKLRAGMEVPEAIDDLRRPLPQVKLGTGLQGIATSCIDISDGLVRELALLAKASGVGMQIDVATLPVHPSVPQAQATHLALTSGDEYQLCFTAPASKREQVEALAQQMGCSLTRIGVIVDGECIDLINSQFTYAELSGFEQFAGDEHEEK